MGLDRKTCRIVAETLSRRSGRNAEGATFVYGLVDPRTCRVRYVGQSVRLGERVSTHRGDCAPGLAFHPSYSPTARDLWLRDLATRGLRPHVTVLAVVPADVDAYPVEVAFIEKYDGPDLFNAQRCKRSAGRADHIAALRGRGRWQRVGGAP